MTVSDTSLEAYASIQPLNDRQASVLGALDGSEPLTNAEIARKLDWTINRITPRTNELVKLGRVKEMGKRPCRITGRRAYTWAAVDYVPVVKPQQRVEYVEVDGVMHARVMPSV